MKIQLASDLHLEFMSRFPGERLISPAAEADILVLAGDIASGTDAIKLFDDWPVPVVYVAGNHEFYRGQWEGLREDLRRAAEGTNLHFLDNDAFVFRNVRFLGSTLWTDFRARGLTQSHSMEAVERALNDFYVIRRLEGTLRARDVLDDHEASRGWLESEFAKAFDGQTCVVTHHGPHPLSVHPRYLGNPLNAGFVSDLSELLPRADLWLHGHVHDSFNYLVLGCRVVANPAGYVRNLRSAASSAEFELENRSFDRRMVIELEQNRTP